jgi:hypothetical protein
MLLPPQGVIDTLPSIAWMREQLTQEPPPGETALSAPRPTLRALLSKRHVDAYYVLCWILSTNRCYLRPVDVEEVRARMGTEPLPANIRRAFCFASLPPEREVAFAALQAARLMVFHGSASESLHSILRNSLRVLSNTRLMTAGAAHGQGVYFARQAVTSLGYVNSRAPGREWLASARSIAAQPTIAKPSETSSSTSTSTSTSTTSTTDKTAPTPAPVPVSIAPFSFMLVCELAQTPAFKDHGWCITHADETSIATRYLLQLSS